MIMLDKYLERSLSEKEEIRFNEYLENNPEMKQEVEFNKKVQNAVKVHSRQELYQHLSDLRISTPSETNRPKTSGRNKLLWLIPIALIFCSSIYYFINKSQQEKERQSQIMMAVNELIEHDIAELSTVGFAKDISEEDKRMIEYLGQLKDDKDVNMNQVSETNKNYLSLLHLIKNADSKNAQNLMQEKAEIRPDKKAYLDALITYRSKPQVGLEKMKTISRGTDQVYSSLALKFLSYE